jgi:hypothetical protein
MSTQFPQYNPVETEESGFSFHGQAEVPVQPQFGQPAPQGQPAPVNHPLMPPTYQQPQTAGFAPVQNQFAPTQNKPQPIGGFDALANGLEPGKCVESRVYENAGRNGKYRTFELFKAFFIQAENKWARGKTFGLNPKVMDEIVARLSHLRNTFLGQEGPGHYVWMPVQQQVAQPNFQQPSAPQGNSARAPYNPTPPMTHGRPQY